MAGGPLGAGGHAAALLLLLFCPARGFNIDIDSAVVYQGSQGSLFGLSVAAHLDQDTGWVLVGAPEAETEQRRWGVQRPGAVFRCETSKPFHCSIIPFDMTGNNNDTGTTIDEKSNQWFGATVSSSGQDGVVVACAPRYVYFSINKKRMEPVGTCFTAVESFTRFSEYSPCRTAAWGYHRQGYCQAGFSAAATKERLFIGTPGSYYWQGQTYSQNLWNRLDLVATEEGPESEDNTYLGYSLALGHFDADGHPDLAVGMPRGANLTGKVIFLTGRTMGQLHNLTGSQVGAYFGHAVAVCDVNGDGLDDVIIGAPLHTDFSLSGGRYETGRVYVVYQNRENKFRKWHIRDGEQTKGRFGFSLASLGDTDKDGFGDFAVGAPYSGPRGEGVVFIFRGSKAGVRERADQIIVGSAVRPGLSSFGFSLSGGVDLDQNSYSDLVVGSPHSSHTLLLRARPVVNLEAEVRFLPEGLGKIDIGNMSCSISSGEDVACTQLRVCLRYSGIGVDSTLSVSTRLELDTRKQLNGRMFFMDREEESSLDLTVTLTKEQEHCHTEHVYLVPNIRDKLTGLEARLSVQLPESRSADLNPVLGLATAAELQPTASLTQDLSLVARDSVSIQKDCGEDNLCVPDLRLAYSRNLVEYFVGSEERFELSLEIENGGEDAYEAILHVDLPESLSYIKTEVVEGYGEATVPVLCSPPTHNNNFVLKCDLGNPMAAGSKALLRVMLQPDLRFLEDAARFQLSIAVNSSNPDAPETAGDNAVNISLPVRVKTDLRIRGLSVPELVRFNRSSYSMQEEITHEAHIGPEIVHIYQVENQGPSDIQEAEVYILWPSFRQDGDPLLYLTAQPLVEGPGRCEYVTDVNAFNIKIDRYRQAQTSSSLRDIGARYAHTENQTDTQHISTGSSSSSSSFTSHSRKYSYSSHTSINSFSSSSSKDEEEGDELDDVLHGDTEVLLPQNDDPNQTPRSSPRGRRDSDRPSRTGEAATGSEEAGGLGADTEFLSELNCGPTRCSFLACTVGPLAKRQFTLLKVRSRLWVRTLDRVERSEIEISSKLTARVTRLPYGVNPAYLGHRSHLVTTQVVAVAPPEAGSIPLWILVLAIVAGLLFLSLLTYILHRLGFFKRKRPEDLNYTAKIQEKPYLGKESKNQLVPAGGQYHLLVNNGSNTSCGSSNGSARPTGAAWDRSRSCSSQRFSQNSLRNSTNSSTVYYPGQRHPDMLPGDEAL